MDEHRFVIALTFEQLNTRRARHLRAMVMWEPMLLDLPDEMPRVDIEEHKTRYRTLQAIGETLPEISRALRHREGVAAEADRLRRPGCVAHPRRGAGRAAMTLGPTVANANARKRMADRPPHHDGCMKS